MGAKGLIHPLLHLAVAGRIAGQIEDRGAADVAGEDQDRVGEIHRAALAIGDPAVIEDLQHHVEHIGVGLLHLVEQHHRIGAAPHGLGELAALLVAHIARRRADQAAHGVLLHVFAHVDPHHRLLGIEELGGQGLGELGLAHAGGAEKQEAGDRSVRIGEACPGALDGIRHRSHGLLLADHTGVELLFEVEQFLHLALHELAHRDARPLGDHFGDVVLGDLLAQERFAGVAAGELDLLGGQLAVEFAQGAVFQLGGLVEVVAALGLLDLELHLLDLFLDGTELIDRTLLLLPLGIEGALLLAQIGEFLLKPLQPIAAGGVGFTAERELFHLQLQDAAIEFIDLFGLGGDLHLQARRRFIHQIDRFVGQEAIGDVAAAQHGGRHQGVVGDAHAVVHLVALLEAAQDRDRVFHGGLIHEHLLEATLQGGVFFDVLAVLIEGGGADAAQFATSQHRLEQVAGIHSAAGGAGPHHGVDLIDEQHDLALTGGDLLEHGLEPLLEFAAILRPSDQGPHVEGDQLAVLQGRGHIAIHDSLGQALHDRRFAHAGLANQHRVVLGAAAEDLNRAADLLIAPDHRIELARLGGLGEVAAVFLQGFVGALRVLIRHLLGATHRQHRLLQLRGRGAGLGEQLTAAALVFGHGEQQVLDRDVAVVEFLLEGIGPIQHGIEALAQVDVVRRGREAGLAGCVGLDLLAEGAHIHAGLLEDAAGQAGLGEQGSEQVLALHLLLALLLGQLLGRHDGAPGLFGEQFGGGMHGQTSCGSALRWE